MAKVNPKTLSLQAHIHALEAEKKFLKKKKSQLPVREGIPGIYDRRYHEDVEHLILNIEYKLRHCFIALAYLRGNTYQVQEQSCHIPPDFNWVLRILNRFAMSSVTKERWNPWLDEALSHVESQPAFNYEPRWYRFAHKAAFKPELSRHRRKEKKYNANADKWRK